MTLDLTQQAGWLPSSGSPMLGSDEAHVWRVRVAQPHAQIAALTSVLSADERGHAARFHFERDRSAFIAARGVLRVLVGHYLGHASDGIAFGYRDKGKPYLVTPPSNALRFNISHSGEFALLAFARSRELGVDIQRRRWLDNLSSLAKFALTAHEYATLYSLPVHDQCDAFFSCWARKEAFVKATGEGVSQFADFDVTFRPGEPARLLRVNDESSAYARWSMHELPVIAGYATALVVEGAPVRIACWDWSHTEGTEEVRRVYLS